MINTVIHRCISQQGEKKKIPYDSPDIAGIAIIVKLAPAERPTDKNTKLKNMTSKADYTLKKLNQTKHCQSERCPKSRMNEDLV